MEEDPAAPCMNNNIGAFFDSFSCHSHLREYSSKYFMSKKAFSFSMVLYSLLSFSRKEKHPGISKISEENIKIDLSLLRGILSGLLLKTKKLFDLFTIGDVKHFFTRKYTLIIPRIRSLFL